jgi:hypothetical protein
LASNPCARAINAVYGKTPVTTDGAQTAVAAIAARGVSACGCVRTGRSALRAETTGAAVATRTACGAGATVVTCHEAVRAALAPGPGTAETPVARRTGVTAVPGQAECREAALATGAGITATAAIAAVAAEKGRATVTTATGSATGTAIARRPCVATSTHAARAAVTAGGTIWASASPQKAGVTIATRAARAARAARAIGPLQAVHTVGTVDPVGALKPAKSPFAADNRAVVGEVQTRADDAEAALTADSALPTQACDLAQRTQTTCSALGTVTTGTTEPAMAGIDISRTVDTHTARTARAAEAAAATITAVSAITAVPAGAAITAVTGLEADDLDALFDEHPGVEAQHSRRA